jgi:hypothetical protein
MVAAIPIPKTATAMTRQKFRIAACYRLDPHIREEIIRGGDILLPQKQKKP